MYFAHADTNILFRIFMALLYIYHLHWKKIKLTCRHNSLWSTTKAILLLDIVKLTWMKGMSQNTHYHRCTYRRGYLQSNIPLSAQTLFRIHCLWCPLSISATYKREGYTYFINPRKRMDVNYNLKCSFKYQGIEQEAEYPLLLLNVDFTNN